MHPGLRAAASTQGMHYRRLTSLGEVSVLELGCGGLGSLTRPRTRRESLSLIAAALGSGITLFDTADIYAQGESERLLGEALRSTDARVITIGGATISTCPTRSPSQARRGYCRSRQATAKELHAGVSPPRCA
jgi:aryl-alcohol dehydrogenase-like predicted oxidoreductase